MIRSSEETEKYWNKKIIKWEKSSYDGETKNLSIIEKIATRFRNPIQRRMEVTSKLLKPTINGKTILDLGCGTGVFCFRLLELGAKEVINLDISPVAIDRAQEKAKKLRLDKQCKFLVGDVINTDLPYADITVGMGFIDYLSKKDLAILFKKMNSPYFLFSFPEQKFSLINLLHVLYLKSQRCPSFYKYKRSEMRQVIPTNKFKTFEFYDVEDIVLIHNLPIHQKKDKNSGGRLKDVS